MKARTWLFHLSKVNNDTLYRGVVWFKPSTGPTSRLDVNVKSGCSKRNYMLQELELCQIVLWYCMLKD